MDLTEFDEDCLSDVAGDECRLCFDRFDVVALYDTGWTQPDKWQMGVWCRKHYAHTVVQTMDFNITLHMKPLPYSKSSKEPSPT